MSRTKVLPIRVENGIADYIDQKVEETGLSRGKVIENVIESYREIEMICYWGDIDAKTCCEQIGNLFREGKIEVVDGCLRVN